VIGDPLANLSFGRLVVETEPVAEGALDAEQRVGVKAGILTDDSENCLSVDC
jgi:hypothetical protein